MKHGDVFWIKMDIDGGGKRWLLAFIQGDMIVFPMEEFEDYLDDQPERYEIVYIESPPE